MKKTLALILALMMVAAGACAASTDLTYPSRDVQVPATLVVPDGPAPGDDGYPLVVLVHGHGGSRQENIGFAAIAQELSDKGIASIRMDFPGCGDSGESFQANTLTNMKKDVLAAIDYVAGNCPGIDMEEVGILGYSMGGRIALELLAQRAYDFEAVALLAPAASTADLKNLFGGAQAYDEMARQAAADGYVVFTTIYGQVQELSKQWFEDLNVYGEDLAQVAAKAFHEDDVLVIYGSDDTAVSPSVSQQVAQAFGAQVIDATGDGHGYGFYSDNTQVLDAVAQGAAQFFFKELAD